MGQFEKSTTQITLLYAVMPLAAGAGGALAPLNFGSFANPISNIGGRLCPPHYCEHPRIRKHNNISVM